MAAIAPHLVFALAGLLLGLRVGIPLGMWRLERYLLQDADTPRRPFRSIAGRLYYVVPAVTYSGVWFGLLRDAAERAGRPRPDGPPNNPVLP